MRAFLRVRSPSRNLRETAYVSRTDSRAEVKLQARSSFSVCGETTTNAQTYTGVPIRRVQELPRMDESTWRLVHKTSAVGDVRRRRAKKELEAGIPFSWFETKSIEFLEEFFKHLGATHIVDLTAGSGALAVAAVGAKIKYVGFASSDTHQQWLDSVLDRASLYMCSKENRCAAFGADKTLCDEVKAHFAGAIMEASRFMEPKKGVDADEVDTDPE